MRHSPSGLPKTRHCSAKSASALRRIGLPARYSTPTCRADTSRRLTPPCGGCGGAAKVHEVSMSNPDTTITDPARPPPDEPGGIQPDGERSNSTGTMGASLELRSISEVLTLSTCGTA